jgi:dimethylhistidine N-methyltransferase
MMSGTMTSVQEIPPLQKAEVLRDVLDGLSRPQKSLPGKYLWDETGSILFDRICRTGDYYLTRSETGLLRQRAGEVAELVGSGATIVEFGSGASRKVRILLDSLPAPRRYIAIDISMEYLAAATGRIACDYPDVQVVPICADYSKPLLLPAGLLAGPTLGFFPGSTVGNFAPSGVTAFLERARRALGPCWFLVGADPNRDEASLRRAYGCADGLMAALHKNMLVHLNRLLGTDFAPEDFRHEARVLDDPWRVEAHLVAVRPVTVRVGGRTFRVGAGESIHTDNAYKHGLEEFRALAHEAGWTLTRCWLAPDGLTSLHLLRP